MRVLVTGATGYVGGLLVDRLLAMFSRIVSLKSCGTCSTIPSCD